jgi:hypothetical protein
MRQKILQRRNRESEMHVTWIRPATGNQMQLIVLANFEPDMPIIAKGIRNDFGVDHVFVKCRAPFQIGDVERDMVEMALHLRVGNLVGGARLCRADEIPKNRLARETRKRTRNEKHSKQQITKTTKACFPWRPNRLCYLRWLLLRVFRSQFLAPFGVFSGRNL